MGRSTIGRALRPQRPPFNPQIRPVKFLFALLLLALAPTPAAAQGEPCASGQDLACFERNGYRVGAVRIETLFKKNVPLDLIFRVQRLLFDEFSRVKPQLALQEGGLFTKDGYNTSVTTMGSLVGKPAAGERFRLVLLEPSVRDCKSGPPPTIDVVYRVFTTDGLSFITSSVERPNDKPTRSVLIPLPGTELGKLQFQPYAGFNRARSSFGGTKAVFQTGGRLVSQLDADVSASGSSATVDVGLTGSRNFDEGFLNYAQWKLGYSYFNLPSDAIRLKGGTLRAQLFGGTRPLGARGVSLRMGASIEGGNRQADFAPGAATPPASAADTPYGALKAYVGSTMNWGRQAWRASYGVQLGQAGKGVRVDYVKQVFDTSYSVRFLPREHRPLRLELGASAGLITARGGVVPVAERFFGGNVRRNFIQGSDWEINSAPLIRSFPQNGLNLIGPNAPVGGRNFFSANLTLAQTAWHYTPIPEELTREPELRIALTNNITTERENTKGTYLYVAPDFKKLLKEFDDLDQALKGLDTALKAAGDAHPAEPVAEVIGAFYNLDPDTNFKLLPDALEAIQTAQANKKVAVDQAVTLAQDVPELSFESFLTILIRNTENSTTAFSGAGLPTTPLTDALATFKSVQPAMLDTIQRINDIAKYSAADVQLVADKVNELTPVLDDIGDKLALLPEPEEKGDDDYADGLAAAQRYLAAARHGVELVNFDDTNVRGAESLAVGYGRVPSAIIEGLAHSLEELRTPLAAKGSALAADASRLRELQAQIRETLKKTQTPEVEKKANRDVAYTARVLDVVFREMNLASVSPLFMFDVAHIGPRSAPPYGELRYGVGGGVRFSLVSLDLDLGYSFNPNRLPGERRGAFVFALNVSDLFR